MTRSDGLEPRVRRVRPFTDLRNYTENGFAGMRGKFDAAAAGQQQIVDMLTTLVDRQAG